MQKAVLAAMKIRRCGGVVFAVSMAPHSSFWGISRSEAILLTSRRVGES